MDKPTIVFSPLQQGVPAAGGALDVLVRVQAPDRPDGLPGQHLPKRLALVVDRSGSMDGRPLAEALACTLHIARHLTPQDSVTILVYDDKVNVLHPLQPVVNIETIERALSGIDSGGSTDLHAGWLEGVKQLEAGNGQAISRVMLLSDGQANHGLTKQAEIEQQCRQWLGRGVTTTTVGLGRGFNEDLMIGMARAGGGQTYYGQAARDLYDSFDEELALLQAIYLRQIELKLIAAPGVVVEMLSDSTEQATGRWRMSDLAWGAESWVAVRLHLSASAAGQARDLLAASLEATAIDGTLVRTSAPLLQLPVLTSDALAALPADETAANRLLELEFARASRALREVARQGDIEATRRALTALEARFGGHPWLRAKIEQMRRTAEEDVVMMAKEASFSAMRMSSRLVAKHEMAFCADETNDEEIPAFLRKKVSEGRGRDR